MARIKPKRHGVVTDMTAMCDVAFLLLTFFILTTEFKQPDVEDIVTPSSISKSKLTEGDNTMTISVTKDGRYYFSPTNNPSQRVELLETMGEKYNITFPQVLYYFRPIIILLSDECYITLLRILYYFSPSDQSISSITACPQLPQSLLGRRQAPQCSAPKDSSQHGSMPR